jgi:hypothetical protein
VLADDRAAAKQCRQQGSVQLRRSAVVAWQYAWSLTSLCSPSCPWLCLGLRAGSVVGVLEQGLLCLVGRLRTQQCLLWCLRTFCVCTAGSACLRSVRVRDACVSCGSLPIHACTVLSAFPCIMLKISQITSSRGTRQLTACQLVAVSCMPVMCNTVLRPCRVQGLNFEEMLVYRRLSEKSLFTLPRAGCSVGACHGVCTESDGSQPCATPSVCTRRHMVCAQNLMAASHLTSWGVHKI